jgi:hypothetical protein
VRNTDAAFDPIMSTVLSATTVRRMTEKSWTSEPRYRVRLRGGS